MAAREVVPLSAALLPDDPPPGTRVGRSATEPTPSPAAVDVRPSDRQRQGNVPFHQPPFDAGTPHVAPARAAGPPGGRLRRPVRARARAHSWPGRAAASAVPRPR